MPETIEQLKWTGGAPDRMGRVLVAGPFSLHRRGAVPARQGYGIKSVTVLALGGVRLGGYPSEKKAKQAAQNIANAIIENMGSK